MANPEALFTCGRCGSEKLLTIAAVENYLLHAQCEVCRADYYGTPPLAQAAVYEAAAAEGTWEG